MCVVRPADTFLSHDVLRGRDLAFHVDVALDLHPALCDRNVDAAIIRCEDKRFAGEALNPIAVFYTPLTLPTSDLV